MVLDIQTTSMVTGHTTMKRMPLVSSSSNETRTHLSFPVYCN